MIRLIVAAGPFGILLVILALLVVALAVRTIMRAVKGDAVDGPKFRNGLNAILFWGCVSAAMGLLGQFSGLWLSLEALSRAETVNPKLVYEGLMASFSTTIIGLMVLIGSGLIWFTLRIWASHRTA
jgi:hypothetical protein